MFTIVSLLVAAALISQQFGFEAYAQIDNSNLNNNIDNGLSPNVVAPPKRQRRLKKYVHIQSRPDEEIRRAPGERLEIECEVMGNPLPAVVWQINGRTVMDVEEDVNEVLPSSTTGAGFLTSKLIITSTTPGVDEYTCIATAGAEKDTATTTVYTLPSEDPEEHLSLQKLFLATKPTITYYYDSILLDIGSVVVLPCRVHSGTKTQVFWRDPNDRVIRDNPRMRVLPSGDLVINGLRWPDMGNFTCYVKNLYGKDVIQTFVYPTKG